MFLRILSDIQFAYQTFSISTHRSYVGTHFYDESTICNVILLDLLNRMLYIDLRSGQTCHSKDGGSAYSIGVGQYGTGLMHRKRVTCELHDSYFHLMTINHAIPKTAEVTHSDGQLWGDIEWAIEILYNSVKTGSQLVGDKSGRESQHSAEGALGTPD